VLAHGGGGELTRRLIEDRIAPKLRNDLLNPLDDSATLELPAGRVCFTTDSYVVQPLVFPGGDIGKLAVCGTVNDLAVMGARPVALSLALIIEEGLSLEVLERLLESLAETAREAGVPIATGDTKVVERGRGDGLIVNTAGIGVLGDSVQLGLSRISPGDAIIVTGRIAEHGLAVMSVREGLEFETSLMSDAAPLNGLAQAILGAGADVKFMRDPTRGGLAGVMADLAEATGFSIEARESDIPLSRVCLHTAEMLGLDPLTVANEGKIVVVVSESDAEKALAAMKVHRYGQHAAIIGRVTDRAPALAELVTRAGGRRIVQRPYGEELPRIC